VRVIEENRIIPDRGKRYCAGIVFPNRYEVATANLGFHWLYRKVNEHPFFWGERFTIESDLSLDGEVSLSDCDLILLSVSFENDLLNIINLFKTLKVHILAEERGDNLPPVIMGGAVTFFNPYPFLRLVDSIVLGEGEDKIFALLNAFVESDGKKKIFIGKISGFDWVITYGKKSGKRFPLYALEEGGWSVFFSNKGEFGRSFLIEIQRGCTHLCRFCGAGYTYLPPRFFGVEKIIDTVETWGEKVPRVGLISPSPSDHPRFLQILERIIETGRKFTLSSIRPESACGELFDLIARGGPDTLTLAPEAGSEEERKILNKNIPDDLFFDFAERASKAGIKRLKLYFIIGREEGEEEVNNILSFLKKLKNFSRRVVLSASFSIFVPKPFTPFQWKSMDTIPSLEWKIRRLRRETVAIGVKATFENIYDAFTEGLIARSDETLVNLIADERKISPKKVVVKNMKLIEELLNREFDTDYKFPWERIETPLLKKFLISESVRAIKGKTTPGCLPERCRKCGVCDYG